MLALIMHAQATGREPAFLDQILDHIPDMLNEKGYLGPVYADGVAHEQAMSGHSWMLRALTEYYQWKKDRDPGRAQLAKAVLNRIVDGLERPQTENYRLPNGGGGGGGGGGGHLWLSPTASPSAACKRVAPANGSRPRATTRSARSVLGSSPRTRSPTRKISISPLDLNGERMQTGNTSTMIFSVAELVSYISTVYDARSRRRDRHRHAARRRHGAEPARVPEAGR